MDAQKIYNIQRRVAEVNADTYKRNLKAKTAAKKELASHEAHLAENAKRADQARSRNDQLFGFDKDISLEKVRNQGAAGVQGLRNTGGANIQRLRNAGILDAQGLQNEGDLAIEGLRQEGLNKRSLMQFGEDSPAMLNARANRSRATAAADKGKYVKMTIGHDEEGNPIERIVDASNPQNQYLYGPGGSKVNPENMVAADADVQSEQPDGLIASTSELTAPPPIAPVDEAVGNQPVEQPVPVATEPAYGPRLLKPPRPGQNMVGPYRFDADQHETVGQKLQRYLRNWSEKNQAPGYRWFPSEG